MGADGPDRRTSRFPADKDAIASRDHTPCGFARRRVALEWMVVNALLYFELSDRFGGISCFVSISRHGDNLLSNRRFTSPFA